MSTTSLNSIISAYQGCTGSGPRVPYSVNCSLCGCNGASVRCAKCNSMAFCIGCDDMYHRHPKRRTHLRQAVALEFIQALEKYQQSRASTPGPNPNPLGESKSDSTQSLYPWRRTKTQATSRGVPENFWASHHPSKMPVPPPRRKKKTLSFSGLKDTFRKLVQPKNVQPEEPIYATIQKSKGTSASAPGSPRPSAFRPLPPPPPGEQVYENGGPNRKYSLQDGGPPEGTRGSMTYEEIRSMTLPHRNLSYHDLSMRTGSPYYPGFPGMRSGPGSTQSVFAGMFPHPHHHAGSMSPGGFCCGGGHHCCSGFHHSHHQHLGSCSKHCSNRCSSSKTPSLANSFDELRHFDEGLSDDEDDDPVRKSRRPRSRTRTRAQHNPQIQRSHSTFTMYPNIPDCLSPASVSNCPNPCCSNISNSNSHLHTSKLNNGGLRSATVSPSPSVKSLNRFEYSNGKASDSVFSDSSSSRSNHSHSITKKELSFSFSQPQAPIQTKPEVKIETKPEVWVQPEPEVEALNEVGQWSCRFCTFFNDPEKNVCEICCKTRAKPVKSFPNAPQPVPQLVSPSTLGTSKGTFKGTTNGSMLNNELFDEAMVREQMEIEREMIRRKENERRVEEKNRKLTGKQQQPIKTNHPNSSIDQTEVMQVLNAIQPEVKRQEPKVEQSKLEIVSTQEAEVPKVEKAKEEQDAIVARIIEEKINEQLSRLKIAQPVIHKESPDKIEQPIRSKEEAKLIESHQSQSSQQVENKETIKVLPTQPISSEQLVSVATNQNPLNQSNQSISSQPIPEQSMSQNHTNQSQTYQQQQSYEQQQLVTSGQTAVLSVYPNQQTNQVYPQQTTVYQQSIAGQNYTYPTNLENYPQQQNQSANQNQANYTQQYPFQQNTTAQQSYPQNYDQQQYPNQNGYPGYPGYPGYQSHHGSTQSLFGSSQYLNQNTSTSGYQPTRRQSDQWNAPLQQQLQQQQRYHQRMDRFSSYDDLQSMSSISSGYQDSGYQRGQVDSGLQIIQTLREAEKRGYTAEDVEVAIQFNPHAPLDWLDDNWASMCETVLTMANNQIIELERATGSRKAPILLVSSKDAKVALRLCKGNIWQSVERCVQRYQDNKVFGSDQVKQLLSKQPTGKAKSFSLKISGPGAGKANNDGNIAYSDEFVEEDVENVMNPEFIYPEMEYETVDNQDLLNWYIEKIQTTDEIREFDPNDLHVLLEHWRYEKALQEQERQALKMAEKEKRAVQKMIDLQKRISGSGYPDDGTTTEEELDKEVELVFTGSREDLRQKLASIETNNDNDDEEPTPQPEADILQPGQNEDENDDEIDKFDEIEERIQMKLNNLLTTRETRHKEMPQVKPKVNSQEQIQEKLNDLLTTTRETIHEEMMPQVKPEVSSREVNPRKKIVKIPRKRTIFVTKVEELTLGPVIDVPVVTNNNNNTIVSKEPELTPLNIVSQATKTQIALVDKIPKVQVKSQSEVLSNQTKPEVVNKLIEPEALKSQVLTASHETVASSKVTNVKEMSPVLTQQVSQTTNSFVTSSMNVPGKTSQTNKELVKITTSQPIPEVKSMNVSEEIRNQITELKSQVSNTSEVKVICEMTESTNIPETSSEITRELNATSQKLEVAKIDKISLSSSSSVTSSVEVTQATQINPSVEVDNQTEVPKPKKVIKKKKKMQDSTQPLPEQNTEGAALAAIMLNPSVELASLPVAQKPVFSKLRGVDKLQRAKILKSEPDLFRANLEDQKPNYPIQRSQKVTTLFRSQSTESGLNESVDKLRKKEHARQVIIGKLRSLESLNQSNQWNEPVPVISEPNSPGFVSQLSPRKPPETLQESKSIQPEMVNITELKEGQVWEESTPLITPEKSRVIVIPVVQHQEDLPQLPIPTKSTSVAEITEITTEDHLTLNQPEVSQVNPIIQSESSEQIQLQYSKLSKSTSVAKITEITTEDHLRLYQSEVNQVNLVSHSASSEQMQQQKSILVKPEVNETVGNSNLLQTEIHTNVNQVNLALNSQVVNDLEKRFKPEVSGLTKQSPQTTDQISSSISQVHLALGSQDSRQLPKPEVVGALKLNSKPEVRRDSTGWTSRVEYSADFQWARTEFECELCTSIVPVADIAVMITCTHYACRECLQKYLTVQIRERQRLVIRCPFCDQPEISADDDDAVFEYLALFDPFVRYLVDPDTYELFQRKVRDRALMRDPNFMWCPQCSSGFIAPNPVSLTIMCPDCRCLTCRKCKKPWRKQHFNLSCARFAEWEESNDPSFAEQQLNKHLKEFGIECPNCHFRYQLAKGGCMHFRCLQCSYDFCGGCSRPFLMGSRCFRAKLCEKLGLHAHHPRHCLFYLRDKEVAELQNLLDKHGIEYQTQLEGEVATKVTRCQVMEQKETDSGMKDEPCNRFVEAAGLCKLHYKEYLGNLIYQNRIDPIHIFNEDELELTLRRENIRIPSRIRGEEQKIYMEKLIQMILDKIPLDNP